jgi:hypothetical protein
LVGAVGVFVLSDATTVGALRDTGSPSFRGAVSGRPSSGGFEEPAVRGMVATAAAPAVAAIAAGGFAGYEVLSDGRVWAWGDDLEGQIGTAGRWRWGSSPVLVRAVAHVVAVAGGENSAYAIERGGTVWAWGDDGQDH